MNIDKTRYIIYPAALVAFIFGLLTLKSGSAVLFFDEQARINAGNYVPFVLWFNFIVGFFYLLAAAGLFMFRPWSARLSLYITLATLVVFALLGLYILMDRPYEIRTVIAMSIRSAVWILISIIACRIIIKRH